MTSPSSLCNSLNPSMATGGSFRKKPNKPSLHLKPRPVTPMSSQMRRFSFRKPILVALPFLLLSFFLFLLSISSNMWRSFVSIHRTVEISTVEVVREFPHDRNAFTQGLLYAENDILYESTGLYHQSSVRKVALQTGKIKSLHEMDHSYFGEGLTLLDERLFQVTWLKKTGFIYDRHNLSKFEQFTHKMQDGWGLATDGKILLGSDGSSTLYQIDPQSMKVLRKHVIRYGDREVHNLNELEYIDGEVWANIFQTDCIVRISPIDGTITGWVLLQNLREGLLASGERGIDVLNGIAWDRDKNRIFVTGKLWPKLYEIKLQPMKELEPGLIEQLCLRMPFHFA